MMKQEDFRVGALVTVTKCKSIPKDRSYQNDIFRVVATQFPLVAMKAVYSRYGMFYEPDVTAQTFSLNDWEFMEIEESFFEAL